MSRVDTVDIKIIELLQQNARMTLKEIAARVYLTSPAVSARIDKLERFGVIEGYHATVNTDALKLSLAGLREQPVKTMRTA